MREDTLLSLSQKWSFSPYKSCLYPKCDNFISEGDDVLRICCNLWTKPRLIRSPAFPGFCHMSIHHVNASFLKKGKRKQKLPSFLSMSNLSKSYWDTQRNAGNFPFHKMRTFFKYFLPTFSKRGCMKWRGNDTLPHWKGDYVKLPGEASRVNANTSMILFISCHCAGRTCLGSVCAPPALGEQENPFLWDPRCSWFANKSETPKITLKERRAPFVIVPSTRCHLKLMRAASSADNEARRGFRVPKGAGDTQGSFPAPGWP